MSPDNQPVSLTQKSMQAGVWSVVQNATRELVGMLVFLALARFFLTDTQIGIVALANLFVIFAQILVRQGLSAALIQHPDLSNDHINAAFWANALTGTVLALAIAVFSHPIAAAVGEPDAGPILQILSIGALFSGLSNAHEALLIRDLKFKSLALRTLVAVLVSGTVSLLIAINGGGIWSLVALHLVNGATGLIVLWTVSPWRPQFRFDLQRLRELFPVSLNMTGIGIVVYINLYVDQFIVGSALGAASLGVYFVAQRLVRSLLSVLTHSMNSISLPSFSKLKSDPVRIRRGLKKAVSLSTFVGAPAFIGLFLISEDVILVLLDEKWIDAAGILRWLCAAAIIRTIVEFNGNILIATGRSRLALIMTYISTALLIVLGLIGAQYDASGVAMALALKNFIMFSIWLFVMQSVFNFKISMYFAAFAGSFAVSLIMALVVLAVRYVTVIEMEWTLTAALPTEIIAGIATYIGASMLITPNLLKEIRQNIFSKLSDKK